jgi:hypothetical protein
MSLPRLLSAGLRGGHPERSECLSSVVEGSRRSNLPLTTGFSAKRRLCRHGATRRFGTNTLATPPKAGGATTSLSQWVRELIFLRTLSTRRKNQKGFKDHLLFYGFSTVQMSLRGVFCRSNLLFYGHFNSKADCHAAKEQERRLAMT